MVGVYWVVRDHERSVPVLFENRVCEPSLFPVVCETKPFVFLVGKIRFWIQDPVVLIYSFPPLPPSRPSKMQNVV